MIFVRFGPTNTTRLPYLVDGIAARLYKTNLFAKDLHVPIVTLQPSSTNFIAISYGTLLPNIRAEIILSSDGKESGPLFRTNSVRGTSPALK